MSADTELLRRYVDERSEAAFAELVRLHVNLVYFAALRQVGGDAHRAQEVAQIVFTDLARKAASLTGRTTLTGWLHTSTRFAAAMARRAHASRGRLLRAAEIMQPVLQQNESDPEWERLRPLIDEAVHDLGARDREAVLLRFFEGRPFAEIGAIFGLSDDAARMRVDRALEKLRAALARRGITSTASALGLAMANQVSAAAPAGLAASLTGAALAGATGTGAVAGIFTFMITTKLFAGAASGVALLALGFAVFEWREAREAAASRAEVSAERDALRMRLAGLEKRLAAAEARAVALTATAPKSPSAPAVQKNQASVSGAVIAPSGMTPVENYVNAGRATPAAAFQTLIWAALAGADEEFAAAVVLSETAREKALAWRATLPAEAQAKYAPVEKLPALFLTEEIVRKGVSAEVIGVHEDGPGMTTLQIRGMDRAGRVSEWPVTMRRGPNGWGIYAPDEMIDGMRKSKRSAGGDSPADVARPVR